MCIVYPGSKSSPRLGPDGSNGSRDGEIGSKGLATLIDWKFGNETLSR